MRDSTSVVRPQRPFRSGLRATALSPHDGRKRLALICLLLATLMLMACSPRQDLRADVPVANDSVRVLEVSASVYDPTGASGDGVARKAECARWALDRRQAETFLRLSHPITAEEQHAAFYHLPCSVKGRLQADGETWDFQINAGATATWHRGDEVKTFGCSEAACAPLVLMMPMSADD